MHFPARAASILFLSIFGHTIGVLRSPPLFLGKELQVSPFKVTCFWLYSMRYSVSGCVDLLEVSLSNMTKSYQVVKLF